MRFGLCNLLTNGDLMDKALAELEDSELHLKTGLLVLRSLRVKIDLMQVA